MISILISNLFLMDFVIGLLFRNPKSFHQGKSRLHKTVPLTTFKNKFSKRIWLGLGLVLSIVPCAFLASTVPASQGDEDNGYENDVTSPPARSTSISDIRVRVLIFLSSKDKTMSVLCVAIESVSRFPSLCQCDRFITLRRKLWGKSYLNLVDIDHATVRDLETFIKKISDSSRSRNSTRLCWNWNVYPDG